MSAGQRATKRGGGGKAARGAGEQELGRQAGAQAGAQAGWRQRPRFGPFSLPLLRGRSIVSGFRSGSRRPPCPTAPLFLETCARKRARGHVCAQKSRRGLLWPPLNAAPFFCWQAHARARWTAHGPPVCSFVPHCWCVLGFCSNPGPLFWEAPSFLFPLFLLRAFDLSFFGLDLFELIGSLFFFLCTPAARGARAGGSAPRRPPKPLERVMRERSV